MTQSISVAVIDNQPLFREGVCSVLSSSTETNLVAQGSDHRDALSIAKTVPPDVMLLDLHLPGGGLSTLREISCAGPSIKTVMLSAAPSEQDLSAAFQAGACGFIRKCVRARQLIDVVSSVHSGELYTEPTFAGALLKTRYTTEADREPDPFETLTHRERDILALVVRGQTNKEIARFYKLAEKTVKHYMTSILQKLSARNRVEAALMARHLFEA